MHESIRARVLVVAALLTRPDGRVLLTQRPADKAHGLGWEFPGGKLEPGEAPAEALERELREEIDVAVEVGAVWHVLHHPYPDFDLLMLVYHCRLRGGEEPRCREVADLAWVRPEELSSYAILPADEPLVARLEGGGVPGWHDHGPDGEPL